MNSDVIITCAVTGSGDAAGKHPQLPKTPKSPTSKNSNNFLLLYFYFFTPKGPRINDHNFQKTPTSTDSNFQIL